MSLFKITKSQNIFKKIQVLLISAMFLTLSACFWSETTPPPLEPANPMGLAQVYSQEAEANFALARVLWKDGTTCSDPILAIEYLNKAIELEPDYADAYLRRGMARSDIENWFRAEEDLTKAIRLKPTPEAYAYRGLVFMRSGNMLGAKRDMDKSIELDKNQHRAWNFRAALNLQNDNYKAACSDFKQGCSNGDCTGYNSAKEYQYCK